MDSTLDNLAVHLMEKYDEIQTEVDQNQRKKISGPNGSSDLCWELYPTHFGSKIGSIRNVKLQKEENQNRRNDPKSFESHWRACTKHGSMFYERTSENFVDTQIEKDQNQLYSTQYGSIRKVKTQTKEDQIQLPTLFGGVTYGSLRKVDTQTEENQIQLYPTKFGSIRNVGDTHKKEEQVQLDQGTNYPSLRTVDPVSFD